MPSYVLRQAVDMEKKLFSQELYDSIESTIDLNLREPNIKLKKNNTLSKERKERRDLNKTEGFKPLTKNVLIITLNSMSRNQIRKKLPKTWSWLEKMYDTRHEAETLVNNKYETFQFPNFHAIGERANINMIPALFGIQSTEKNAKYYIKYFKDNGYITGSSVNWCGREVFEMIPGNQIYLNWEAYDHELSGIFCDPNFTPFTQNFPVFNGPYSINKRCLYGKQTIELSISYLKQFWESYIDDPKVFRWGIVDGVDFTGQVIKYDDDLIFDTLNEFERKGYLNDTTLIIHSDHGNNNPGPYSFINSFDFQQELALPALFITLPKNLDYLHNFTYLRKNLKDNEYALITPYDLYHTILQTMGGNIKYENLSGLGESLFFNKLNNYQRDCKHFNIDDVFCKCMFDK